MNLWRQIVNWFWPLIGGVGGIMLGGWITKGSPLKADWLGGFIVLAAFMIGRAIRKASEKQASSTNLDEVNS